VAFFFRDRFVFDFLAAGPERLVGFLFGLAMAIDPYLKSALRSLLFSPGFVWHAQTMGACSHDS
jgi:hypothetical protein